jgi:hypothetical protein
MITRDQIVLERLENELDQTWHLLQTTNQKELVNQMLKQCRAAIKELNDEICI